MDELSGDELGEYGKLVKRIIEDNQRARTESQDRTSRLLDAFLTGDRQEYTDSVQEILNEALGTDDSESETPESSD